MQRYQFFSILAVLFIVVSNTSQTTSEESFANFAVWLFIFLAILALIVPSDKPKDE